MDWIEIVWTSINTLLFAVLLGTSWMLYRRANVPSVRWLSMALLLVSASLVLGGIGQISGLADSLGILPAAVTDRFGAGYRLTLHAVVSITGIFVLTRLRAVLQRVVEGVRMVQVLTERIPLDISVSDWGLTARELEVLETIVAGHVSDADIAAKLYISPATAATHVRNILKKSGLSSRMDLMLVGGRTGPAEG